MQSNRRVYCLLLSQIPKSLELIQHCRNVAKIRLVVRNLAPLRVGERRFIMSAIQEELVL